jgi:hypothetical protein
MAPTHIDPEGPGRAAVAASTLVRRLAEDDLALTAAADQPELATLAARLGSLAERASTVARAIEETLTTASRGVADPTSAVAVNLQLQLTDGCVRLLTGIVDLAAEIYAAFCAQLADHVAIVEEHTHSPRHHGGQPLAAMLGATARALATSQAID